jgi:glycosyltransferase involved in cell wall biosynthesis
VKVAVRIAFVVQRYGLEVSGGAELEARLIAEHLAPYVQVEVLTTCALDYVTWKNHYPPGIEQVNGIPVRRFPVRTPRDMVVFNQFSAKILSGPHSYYDEIQWMAMQGPDVPGLFQFIRDHQRNYDLFLFFTYLYSTTFVGLQIVPFKSILVPTAHDEPWIYLDIFRTVFHLPRAFVFNSFEEERFVRSYFQNRYIPGAILGVGIEVQSVPSLAMLADEYILYLGRIDESKGCGELFRYFLRYKAETHDPVKLVLVGSQVMAVPKHPDILALGFLEDADRFCWLQYANLLVMPSPYESLSMATLEAWALGVPVLVNAAAVVLKSHCLRSQGGLYYNTEDEFIAALRLLRSDKDLRVRLGAQGKAYVEREYRWESLEKRYVVFFRKIYDLIYAGASGQAMGGADTTAFISQNSDCDRDQYAGVRHSGGSGIG